MILQKALLCHILLRLRFSTWISNIDEKVWKEKWYREKRKTNFKKIFIWNRLQFLHFYKVQQIRMCTTFYKTQNMERCCGTVRTVIILIDYDFEYSCFILNLNAKTSVVLLWLAASCCDPVTKDQGSNKTKFYRLFLFLQNMLLRMALK